MFYLNTYYGILLLNCLFVFLQGTTTAAAAATEKIYTDKSDKKKISQNIKGQMLEAQKSTTFPIKCFW